MKIETTFYESIIVKLHSNIKVNFFIVSKEPLPDS